MNTLLRFLRTKRGVAASAFLLGALLVLIVRFFAYTPDETHYHANFSLYVNGQQEKFTESKYYEETEMCKTDETIVPSVRAHMHDNINNVVHVEDHAVTWGHFFANLGWTLGSGLIQSANGTVYTQSDKNKLHIVINGQDYTDISELTNRVINDKDRLLVSFGDIDAATLKKEYNDVPSTAAHYDQTPDPDSCSGHESGSFQDRLAHLFS